MTTKKYEIKLLSFCRKLQQKGETKNRRKTKKKRTQKERENVWMSLQLVTSTSEQEEVRLLIATALLKGYTTYLLLTLTTLFFYVPLE